MSVRTVPPRFVSTLAILSLFALATGGASPAGSEPNSFDTSTLALTTIPPHPAKARTGTEFARSTSGISGPERQKVAVAEVLSGNVPTFVRLLRPVTIAGVDASGQPTTVTLWVTPDYVAIGRDDDFLRIPLTWPSATAIAREFGCVPPTSRLVDAIWSHAEVHLKPAPLPPGAKMRSSEYYLRHRALIEGQRGNLPPSTLVAGHKKDVVLSNRLLSHGDRIAIYGWHRTDGNPIQPLSTVHGARYADYSHGLRLVCSAAVNGEVRPLLSVLADEELAPLLSSEGPIKEASKLLKQPA